MKKLVSLLALSLTACGGVEPELYNLVIQLKDAPDSCYRTGNEPNTTHPEIPSVLVQVQVFDGPDATSYLTVTEGDAQYTLGEAGAVYVGGVFDGAKPDGKGTAFTTAAQRKTTNGAGTLTTTVSSSATITFPRGGGPLTGTASISASTKCEGTGCPTDSDIACSLTDLAVTGARIKTDWQRAP